MLVLVSKNYRKIKDRFETELEHIHRHWIMKLLEDLHTKGTLYFSTHCCMSVKTRILLLGNIISIILDCFLNVGLFCKDD